MLFSSPGLPAQDVAMVPRPIPDRKGLEPHQTGISLADALERLSQTYRVFFTYEISVIENKHVLSPAAGNGNVERDLDRLLQGTGLTYKKIGRRNYAITRQDAQRTPDRRRDKTDDSHSGPRRERGSMQLLPPIMSGAPGYVRPILFPITGVVADSEGQPLIGVNILVKGSSLGTVTDIDGRFSLDLPNGDQVLVVSYVGYQTLEVPVAGRSEIQVTLAASAAALDEVVVIGYGSVRRSDLTGSVSQVSSKDIDALPVPNIEQALRGRSAGVRVTQNSGQPGAPVQIQIRGGNSFLGNNNPLFVVDGFPITGGIDFLNPSDIQSIDILKDASATAIYGARGANGVVIITTKGGGGDRGRVTFDSYYGIQTVRKTFDLMNARQYAEIANERAQNDGAAPPFDLNNLPGFNTDWQEEVFQSAPIQSYTLSFDGVSNKTNYSVSGNYFSQDGVVINSGIKRGSLRLGLDQDINDRLTVSTHFVGTRFQLDNISANNGHRGDNILSSAYVSPPTVPVRNEDGSLSNVSPYFFSPNVLQHPLLYAQITDEEQLTTILADLSAELAITNDLSFKVIFGTEQNFSERNFYSPSTVLLSSPTGEAATAINRSVSYLNENILTYTKSFDRDKLVLVGGFTYQDFQSRFNRSSGSGFVNDILLNNNLGAAEVTSPNSSNFTEWTLLSWLGRANYSLRDKFLFTASIRADGSSRFGANNKWGIFPSGAFAWRLSEEEFIRRIGVISNLKLRLSYGQTGNTAISPFQSLNRLGVSRATFGKSDVIGFAPVAVANNDLKWETTTQINVGVDGGLFNERLRLTADYYRKNTRDLLANITLPGSVGFSSVIANLGEIQNSGFELGLGADIFVGALCLGCVRPDLLQPEQGD